MDSAGDVGSDLDLSLFVAQPQTGLMARPTAEALGLVLGQALAHPQQGEQRSQPEAGVSQPLIGLPGGPGNGNGTAMDDTRGGEAAWGDFPVHTWLSL